MTVTIEEIMSEMESDIEIVQPKRPDDIGINQLMLRWNCGWKMARQYGDKLVKTGKWEWVMAVGEHGRRILVLRKSKNGKAKKR